MVRGFGKVALVVLTILSECQCPHGYNDRWCENDLCLNLSCQHNGTCARLLYEQKPNVFVLINGMEMNVNVMSINVQ